MQSGQTLITVQVGALHGRDAVAPHVGPPAHLRHDRGMEYVMRILQRVSAPRHCEATCTSWPQPGPSLAVTCTHRLDAKGCIALSLDPPVRGLCQHASAQRS
jgi:hypothetical protein